MVLILGCKGSNSNENMQVLHDKENYIMYMQMKHILRIQGFIKDDFQRGNGSCTYSKTTKPDSIYNS